MVMQFSHNGSPSACDMDLDTLQAYVLHLLNDNSKQRVSRHLENCESCSAIVKEIESISPESTEAYLTDSSQNDPDPFPVSLQSRITGLKRHRHFKDLSVFLKKLAMEFHSKLQNLIDQQAFVLDNQPGYAAIRRVEKIMQIDIVNLTRIDLDETNLRPEITPENCLIAGFPKSFSVCSAFQIFLPVSEIRTYIPGWRREQSQSLLTTYFSSPEFSKQIFNNALVIPGQFQTGADESSLRIDYTAPQQKVLELRDMICMILLQQNE